MGQCRQWHTATEHTLRATCRALDFDGVACDSVGESSLSAFKVRCCAVASRDMRQLRRTAGLVNYPPLSTPSFQAAAKLWPDVFVTPEAEARKGELVEAMRIVRPVVETG